MVQECHATGEISDRYKGDSAAFPEAAKGCFDVGNSVWHDTFFNLYDSELTV